MKKTTAEAINEFVTLSGGKKWELTSKACTGDWRGATDYGILIDGRTSLYVATGWENFEPTIREWTHRMKIFNEKKDYNLRLLRERTEGDNGRAEAAGLHPVKVLDLGIFATGAPRGFMGMGGFALLEVNGRRLEYSSPEFSLAMWNDGLREYLTTCGAGNSARYVDTHFDYLFLGELRNSRSARTRTR